MVMPSVSATMLLCLRLLYRWQRGTYNFRSPPELLPAYRYEGDLPRSPNAKAAGTNPWMKPTTWIETLYSAYMTKYPGSGTSAPDACKASFAVHAL